MSRSLSQTHSQEIDHLYRLQRAAQQRVPFPPQSERIRKLKRLRRALLQHRQAIQDALYADFRKAPEEVDLIELQPLIAEIDHALQNLKQWMRPERVGAPLLLIGTASEVEHQPKGLALIIAPWNYPVLLTFGPLISALAAGNRVIMKPSEFTPSAAAVMQQIVAETFDEEDAALITGGKETAEQLLELPFDHFFFTGSPAVGKIVMKAAAEHLSSVTLELGGKSPAVVDDQIDVEDAAWKIVWGKFSNAGQTCIAPDYVLVQRDREAELVFSLQHQLRRFYGNTEEDRQQSPYFARIVDDRHFERLEALLNDAVQQGARVAAGGTTNATERYVAPTLLTDVPDEADVFQEEIFGPLLPVRSFDHLDEALAFIRQRPNPLTLYLYSDREETVDRMRRETTSGSLNLNSLPLHFFNPELPFGGAGSSGIGRSHGFAGFRAFSNERALLRRSLGSAALEAVRPPYTRFTQKLIDGVLKYL